MAKRKQHLQDLPLHALTGLQLPHVSLVYHLPPPDLILLSEVLAEVVKVAGKAIKTTVVEEATTVEREFFRKGGTAEDVLSIMS